MDKKRGKNRTALFSKTLLAISPRLDDFPVDWLGS
jgi:hypothetical protein